jgi:hypothetical protein
LYLVQAKWSKDGSSSPNLDGVNKFLKGISDLLEQKFSKFNAKFQKYVPEVTSALLDPNCRIVSVLVHTSNQKLGDHPQREIDEFCIKVNDTTEFLEVVNLDQTALFKSLALSGAAQNIDLTIGVHEWGKKEDPYSAIYGTVDAEQIAQWWDEHQGRLFSKNLRGILGETTVNKEMRDTLEKAPQKFWYYNNGITIVASKIKKGALNATNRSFALFQCEGVSVVNGAQTVSTIGRYSSKAGGAPGGVFVPVRIISVEGEDALDMEITRANNSQNRIEGRDFAAIDEQQQRLKLELSILGVNYQLTRSEGFAPGPKTFDVEEALIALACSKGDADLAIVVKREIGKFWENTKRPPYTDVIRPNVHGQTVFNAVLIQRKIDSLIAKLSHASGNRESSILIWSNKIISSIVFSKLNKSWASDQTSIIEEIIQSPEFEQQVSQVSTLVIDEVNTSHAAGYIANTFKNASKSKAIYGAVAAKYLS